MSSITEDRISKSNVNTTAMARPWTNASAIKLVLLLAGAFTFSFLLGEAVHEVGHYLAHGMYGNQGVLIHLDPFGGSRIMGVSGFESLTMGAVTAAAGPVFNLLLASALFFLLWRRRKTWLLPLLLWGPVAMIQEGLNFSIGLLTPGGDAQWIVSTGLPAPILVISGVLLICSGVFLITNLLQQLLMNSTYSLLYKFCMITIGFCSLMGIRFIHSLLMPAQQRIENLIPFVFSALLSSVVTLLSCKIKMPGENRMAKKLSSISWKVTMAILSAGIAMFFLQVFIG